MKIIRISHQHTNLNLQNNNWCSITHYLSHVMFSQSCELHKEDGVTGDVWAEVGHHGEHKAVHLPVGACPHHGPTQAGLAPNLRHQLGRQATVTDGIKQSLATVHVLSGLYLVMG